MLNLSQFVELQQRVQGYQIRIQQVTFEDNGQTIHRARLGRWVTSKRDGSRFFQPDATFSKQKLSDLNALLDEYTKQCPELQVVPRIQEEPYIAKKRQ